jgi:hypothetical protein
MKRYLDQTLRNNGLSKLAKRLSALCNPDFQVQNQEAMECILANLSLGSVLISIPKSEYYPMNRYKPFSHQDICIKMSILEQYQFVISFKIAYRPSDMLRTKLETYKTSNVISEPIILRRQKYEEEKYNDIEYDDTEEINILRENLIKYNEWMSLKEVTSLNKRYSTALRRIFNNASFHEGGRFYGASYQELAGHDNPDNPERAHRRTLLINGEETVELDYAAIHPTLLAVREGLPVPEDPYAIDGIDRAIVKRAYNVAINAPGQYSAVWAVCDKLNLQEEESIKVLSKIMKHMGALGKYLCSGEGVRLQNRDSNIAAGIMMECMEADVPVLVVHDSFRVEKANERFLKDLMVKHFQKEMQTTHIPSIKVNE